MQSGIILAALFLLNEKRYFNSITLKEINEEEVEWVDITSEELQHPLGKIKL